MPEGTSMKPLVVGLTGGIGSGKSAGGECLCRGGHRLLTDTDAIAHALTAPGERGYDAVLAEFGRLSGNRRTRSTAPLAVACSPMRGAGAGSRRSSIP
jgi:hypothetical protein